MPSLLRQLFSAATLRTYLSPSGRMARLSYFGCCLRLSVALSVAIILPAMLIGFATTLLDIALVLVICLGIGSFFCLTSQRLQDMGISGWHAAWSIGILLLSWPILSMVLTPTQFSDLVYFKPFIVPIVVLILALVPGMKTDNRFGSPPAWTFWGSVNDDANKQERVAAEESRQANEIATRFD